MSTLWHYARNDQRYGPILAAELKRLADSGELLPGDLVWKEGMGAWVTADKLKGLFPPTAEHSPVPVAPVPPTLPPVAADPFAGLGSVSPPAEMVSSSQPDPPPSTVKSAFGSLKGTLGKWGAAASAALQRPADTATVPAATTVEIKPDAKLGSEDKPPAPEAVPKRLPAGVIPEQVLLEVPAAYEGGHPNLLQKATGRLLMTESGFFFVNESGGLDVEAPYAQVRDAQEPRIGQFPKALVDRAGAYQTAAKIGGTLARFGGTMMGGSEGRAVKAIGGAASEVVQGSTALGPPPKNRLTIIVLEGGTAHKVLFDIGGESKADIEQKAESFWFRIATVRSRFKSGSTTGNRGTTGQNRPNPLMASLPPAGIVQSAGIRLLTPGGVVHLSVSDLLARVNAGQVSDSDMVAVESWLPVGTVRQLFGVGGVEGVGGPTVPRSGQPNASGQNRVNINLNMKMKLAGERQVNRASQQRVTGADDGTKSDDLIPEAVDADLSPDELIDVNHEPDDVPDDVNDMDNDDHEFHGYSPVLDSRYSMASWSTRIFPKFPARYKPSKYLQRLKAT